MKFIRKHFFPLLVSIFAIALAIAGVGVIDGSSAGVDAERIAQRTSKAAATSGTIRTWFDQTKDQAAAIARTLEPWNGRSSQLVGATDLLDDSLVGAPRFGLGGFVVDRDDRVVATSTKAAASLALIRDLPHIDSALRGRVVISPIYEDESTKSLRIDAAVPLSDSGGTTRGALVLGVTADGSLQSAVAALLSDGEQSETLFLVSPSGYAISGESGLGVRRDHPNIAQAMGEVSNRSSGTEQTDSGFVTFNGEGGIVQTAAFSDTDGWTLLWIEESESFFIYGSTFADRAMSDTPTRTAIVWAVLAFLPILAIVYIQNRRENQASMKAEEISHAFLAITGHELRTPLTSLRGFSQMLAGRWDTMPDEQKKEMIATISRHARTLEHLIERLLLGGQMEAGIATQLMERTVDARKALLDAVEQFDGLSPIHRVTLEAPEELSISADPKAFGQVMSHLLENAIKYSPSGGDVWVKTRKNGKWVEISVEDEGVGLPSDTSRMFEKFGQTEAVNTRTVEEGGVGLGLFIVRKHLEAMGGKVHAERRDPKGARFVVVVRSANHSS